MVESRSPRDAPLWGVSAEFASADALLTAVMYLRGRGLGRLDAFSPMPLPAVTEALEPDRRPLRLDPFAVIGAVAGGGAMMGLCCYTTMISYRFNIGGRPAFSWPAFLVPSLSFAMLAGAIVATGMLLHLNRLPRLNHPAFNIPSFTRTSSDRFFLIVESVDESFDPAKVRREMEALSDRPHAISDVPR